MAFPFEEQEAGAVCEVQHDARQSKALRGARDSAAGLAAMAANGLSLPRASAGDIDSRKPVTAEPSLKVADRPAPYDMLEVAGAQPVRQHARELRRGFMIAMWFAGPCRGHGPHLTLPTPCHQSPQRPFKGWIPGGAGTSIWPSQAQRRRKQTEPAQGMAAFPRPYQPHSLLAPARHIPV